MTGLDPKRRTAPRQKVRSLLGVVLVATVVGVVLLGAFGARVTAQSEGPIILEQDQDAEVACQTGVPTLVQRENGTYRLTCVGSTTQPGAPATANPPASGTPAGVTTSHSSDHDEVGVCGESMHSWHPPVIDGCATGHEHGDAPPGWIAQAGFTPTFHGEFNTSPTEHTRKHSGMKGFLTRFADVDIYFRVHATSNVLDRSTRYHSYQVWARDPSGGVSHWQGWYNSGDPIADRFPRRRGVETEKRPAILVVDQTSWEQGIKCEQWYATTASWSWDFGWTICGINALYYPGEAMEQDQRFWRAPEGQPGVGTLRRLEAAWYGNNNGRMHPEGQFWATQFGEIVAGPDDPRCSEATTAFDETYPNVCLEQYIAPTMHEVAYPNINAEQRQFDSTGVRVPN